MEVKIKLSKEILDKYKRQKARFVEMDLGAYWEDRKIIGRDLLDISGGIIRHDSKKLSQIISQII